MLGYSSLDIIFSSTLTVFLELRSRKLFASRTRQSPRTYSHANVEANVFIILQTFFETHAGLKIGIWPEKYQIFNHVTRLDNRAERK